MSERDPDMDELDRWLAEVDRRLSAIQRELAQRSGPSAGRPGQSSRDLVVFAGPFQSTEGLHAFEQALSAMPGVQEVIVREYAGEDRAIVDVRLGDPTP